MTATRTSSDGVPHIVRKRDYHTRLHDRRHRRPKRPAPSSGWLLAELAQLVELPESKVRYYMNEKLIRTTERRGTITRYQRRELMRLVGVLRLKGEGKATLAEIKKQLDAMTEAELESWLRSGPIPSAAAAALGITGTALATEGANHSATSTLAAHGTGTVVEQWQRIRLLPGLDLILRADASDVARFAAERIVSEFLVSR